MKKIPSMHKYGILKEIQCNVGQIITDVKNDYFSHLLDEETGLMTADQCTLFQYQAYKRLIRYFIVKTRAVAYDDICKDGMDRAGIINGGKFFDVLVENGEDQNQEAIDDFRVILHSPAFEIKDQAIISGEEDKHNNRGNLLIKSLKHIEDLPSEAKEKLRKHRIPGTKKWTVRCSPPTSQELYPTYGNAKNGIEIKQAEELDMRLIHNKQISVREDSHLSEDEKLQKNSATLEKFVKDIYVGDSLKNKCTTDKQTTSEIISEEGENYRKITLESKINIADPYKEFMVIAEAIEDIKNQKIYLTVKRK